MHVKVPIHFLCKKINRFEDKIILMYTLGMTINEMNDQIHELFGCTFSDDRIKLYPFIFIDVTNFNARNNGSVVKKSTFVFLEMSKERNKEVLSTIFKNESEKV